METSPAVPLAPRPSALTRLKSRVLHDVVSLGLPQRVLFTRGKTDRKRVALTFDDGPDKLTREYLAACDHLDLRATFFVVGENVEKDREAVLEMVRRGHEVAGHGFTHRPFPGLGEAELVDELARTADLLPPSFSRRPFVRPPTGAVTLSSLARTAAAGYTTALWSLDSDDCRTTDPRVVEEKVSPANVRNGEIVLLHEEQRWTLDALPRIASRLKDAGFAFVTLTEILGS